MTWAGNAIHIAGHIGEMRNAYKILGKMPEGRKM
jgi:hypothetical protein